MLFQQIEAKLNREAYRSKQLRLSAQDRAKDKAAKHASHSTAQSTTRSAQSVKLCKDDVLEASRLVHSPPVLTLSDSKKQPAFPQSGARQIRIVDLPRKPHKKTLSSEFEVLSMPRVIVLSDSLEKLPELTAVDDDDWEQVEDPLAKFSSPTTEMPKISYADAAKR